MLRRISENETYDTALVQDREAEDMNFSQPYEDKEVRRTNPKRHDQRTDWTAMNNEKGHDSDVANRYANMPVSLLLLSIEKLCNNPSAEELTSFQNFIHTASDDIRKVVLSYVQEQYDALVVDNKRIASNFSRSDKIDSAIRYYILSHIFG